MSVSEYFHVGIVAADLPAAQVRLTELLGTRWGPVIEPEIEWHDGDGHAQVTTLKTCFGDGPPYIELIEERPGTPWVCNEHSNLHHISYYATSLAGDSRHLTTVACPLELTMGSGPEPAMLAYHRDAHLGIRIELVDDASRESMQALFAKP